MAKKGAKIQYRKRKAEPKFSNYRYIVLLVSVASLLVAAIVLRSIYIKKRGSFNDFNETGYGLKYPVRGVDVSHHNEYVNWAMLIEDKVSFVFMKSTEGNDHTDREYNNNYNLAREVGLKVGTYHFYTFGMDGREQAMHFINNSHIDQGDIIPAIDVEHSKINRPAKTKKVYTEIIAELKKMEEVINEHFGVKPIIYTNKNCYQLYIKDNFPDNPLWICDLHNEPNDDYSHWEIWQFSHTGNLFGAIGDIDLNYFRGSFEEFNSLLLP